MIPPHKRTKVFSKWKEYARKEEGISIRDDRPFGLYKQQTELRMNTDHSVIIAFDGENLSVWNKPLQYAGKPITVDELIRCERILYHVWKDIGGYVE